MRQKPFNYSFKCYPSYAPGFFLSEIRAFLSGENDVK